MKPPYELPRQPNPWPLRIWSSLAILAVGLGGAMLLSGLFGFLDGYFPL